MLENGLKMIYQESKKAGWGVTRRSEETDKFHSTYKYMIDSFKEVVTSPCTPDEVKIEAFNLFYELITGNKKDVNSVKKENDNVIELSGEK